MSEEKDKKGHFKVINRTKMADLANGTIDRVSESDLCFQNETDVRDRAWILYSQRDYGRNRD